MPSPPRQHQRRLERSERVAWSFEEAIRDTLENAVRAPYYRRSFQEVWREVKSLDDLALLPLLDKPTAIAHQRDLIVGRAPPGFGIASSGTSRVDRDMPILNLLRVAEEFGPWQPDAPVGENEEIEAESDPYPGWTLVSVSVNHGLPGEAPRDEIFVPWMYSKNALYMLEAMLSEPQPDGRRVTAMRISVGALKVFTAWLLERKKDPAQFGVRLIGTNSFHLSPFWQRLISEKFGATLFDNYSLSEFTTPATECKACGGLHFGWPPLVYEVLDLASGRRKNSGVGKLVLTGLYPFVQKMPLIRYDTGDVVELGPNCAATGALSLRFLGRLSRGIVVDKAGEGAYLLAPTLVQDVLEELPESERTPHPCFTLGYISSRDIGLPRWEIEFVPGPRPTALLRFEVRFDPHLFEERARELASHVASEILRLDRRLHQLKCEDRIDLKILPVRGGTLSPPPDKLD